MDKIENKNKIENEENEIKEDKNLNDIKIGLKNIGETCYINSILQCLSQTQKLTNYFLNKFKYNENDNKKKVSNAFYIVLKSLWDYKNNNTPYGPYTFKKVIGEENPLFKGEEQQDSKDFYIFLLEKIHQELNIIKNTGKNINNNINDKNDINKNSEINKDKIYEIFENNYKNNNNSIISKLFYGITEKKIYCKECNFIKYSYEKFYFFDFRLDLVNIYFGRKSNSDLNIFECFYYYQREENIKGKNKTICNFCKNNAKSYNSLKIYSLPIYLVIILNRDHGNSYRCKVTYPEILDLNDFVIQKEEMGILYDLYAIVCHLGPDENSGHFFSYCRHRINNKWYLYNDSIVTECDGCNDLKGLPYILFYQKINN